MLLCWLNAARHGHGHKVYARSLGWQTPLLGDWVQHGNLNVLVYADRLSGWPVIHQWRRDPTTREVVQAVVRNFVKLGVPNGRKRWLLESGRRRLTPPQNFVTMIGPNLFHLFQLESLFGYKIHQSMELGRRGGGSWSKSFISDQICKRWCTVAQQTVYSADDFSGGDRRSHCTGRDVFGNESTIH
jgi:hypothetical protein